MLFLAIVAPPSGRVPDYPVSPEYWDLMKPEGCPGVVAWFLVWHRCFRDPTVSEARVIDARSRRILARYSDPDGYREVPE